MKILQSILLAFVFLFLSNAMQAQNTNDPTSWTYEVKKKSVNEYELIFHVSLKTGWHIFSQKPGDEFLIPPSFNFTKSGAVTFVGKMQERGKLKIERMDGIDNPIRYYESQVDFVQTVKVKPGTKIRGEHEYQVCSTNMCLPPKKKNFEFIVKD